MEDASISTKQCFFGSLESARGVAALAVAGFHCGQSRWTQGDLLRDAYDRDHFIWGWLSELVAILFNGHAAVIFFFALSGFVLTYSSQEKTLRANNWWQQFLWRRILRIYPAVIATVGIFVLIYYCTGLAIAGVNASHFRVGEVLLNMLLVHTSIDGVMWSLRVEMLAMPVVMLGIVFCKQDQQRLLFPLASVLAALYFLKEWRELAGSQFAFTFGAIACVYARPIAEKLENGKSAVGCVAFLAILFARPILGQSSLWAAIVEAAGSACLVGWLAYTQQHVGRRFLDSKWIRDLGKISYSFYLLHPLALLIFWRAQNEIEYLRALGVPSGLLVIGLTFSSTLIICPIAWFVWRMIEVPLMRMGKNALSQRVVPTIRQLFSFGGANNIETESRFETNDPMQRIPIAQCFHSERLLVFKPNRLNLTSASKATKQRFICRGHRLLRSLYLAIVDQRNHSPPVSQSGPRPKRPRK